MFTLPALDLDRDFVLERPLAQVHDVWGLVDSNSAVSRAVGKEIRMLENLPRFEETQKI